MGCGGGGGRKGAGATPVLSSQVRLLGLETQDLDSTALESSVSYFIDKKIYIHLSIYLSIHPSIFTHKLLSIIFLINIRYFTV